MFQFGPGDEKKAVALSVSILASITSFNTEILSGNSFLPKKIHPREATCIDNPESHHRMGL
ncbi:MAG: hypothetical protein C4519_28815 [Desulfobacteraceae bacterium]|nr:MAG: hypothetical protein C4519_28815 [Desulfobacteraceae bacterium]